MINTNSFKMTTPKGLSNSSIRKVVNFLLQKYHCLPTPIVCDYCNRILKYPVSSEAITATLRKMYASKEIKRISTGVYSRIDF